MKLLPDIPRPSDRSDNTRSVSPELVDENIQRREDRLIDSLVSRKFREAELLEESARVSGDVDILRISREERKKAEALEEERDLLYAMGLIGDDNWRNDG